MPFVNAGGVQVNFPFEPYECQLNYMQKVVTCLQQGYNGILESPTGTGKTLCLLCASLAWLEDKKAQVQSQRWLMKDAAMNTTIVENAFKDELTKQLDQAAGSWAGEMNTPKIIYASRTHSQLGQAIQELKRTAYSHFKACVIGSREQLCIHPQVAKEQNNTVKVHLCRAKVSARSCHFYNQVENGKGNFVNQVLDIEDLVTLGQKHNCCPYYVARELKKDADIIFMPYNYLLDPKSRKAHGVDLQGNVVIFDEAHNLEQICEDSSSFDLSSSDIACAVKELNHLVEKIQEWQQMELASEDSDQRTVQDFTLEDILQIKAQLLHLEQEIDAVELSSNGLTKPGSFIFELFDKINLTFENKNAINGVLEKMVAFLSNDTSSSLFNSRGYGLSKILDVIKIVFSSEPTDFAPISNHKKVISKHYKVHLRENTNIKKKKCDGWGATANQSGTGRIFSYWCFSPGHTMQELKACGVKSIILTSGTLSPLSSFSSEMGIDFKIQLENPHVIDKEQVWIGTIGKGPDGVKLSSAYDTRFNENYQLSLGNSVVNFARTVPSGLLIFFPSYPVMHKCLEKWQQSGIRDRIEQHKALFVEPKSKVEFATAMDNFYEKVNDPSIGGAIFAAVCRGKVSEGLDFSDNNGRAVVITGLPFPPRLDPKVILKMKFLDEVKSQGGEGLGGELWYRQQASRAVNQAIGRVIRHRHDYGAILLCDFRFCENNYANQLPLWLRPVVRNYAQFGLAMRDMMNFFKAAEKLLPNPNPTKRRKKPGDVLGCQGAYFMPASTTMSRRQAIGQLEKASVVATHVPSLQTAIHDELSLARMKQSYGGASTSSAPQPKSLLTALNQSEKTHSHITSDFEYQPLPLNSPKKTITDTQKPKKKIYVKKVENSNPITKESLETAEIYLAEVKKVLSEKTYLYFSKSLMTYRTSGELAPMVQCLAEIFVGDARNHHLFRKFIRFVRRPDRESFLRHCNDLLGPDLSKVQRSEKETTTSEGSQSSSGSQHKRLRMSLSTNNVC